MQTSMYSNKTNATQICLLFNNSPHALFLLISLKNNTFGPVYANTLLVKPCVSEQMQPMLMSQFMSQCFSLRNIFIVLSRVHFYNSLEACCLRSLPDEQSKEKWRTIILIHRHVQRLCLSVLIVLFLSSFFLRVCSYGS